MQAIRISAQNPLATAPAIRYGIGMDTDGMTLKLERTKARLRRTQIAAQMGVSEASVKIYEGQAVVAPHRVKQYREAIATLTDVDERATA